MITGDTEAETRKLILENRYSRVACEIDGLRKALTNKTERASITHKWQIHDIQEAPQIIHATCNLIDYLMTYEFDEDAGELEDVGISTYELLRAHPGVADYMLPTLKQYTRSAGSMAEFQHLLDTIPYLGIHHTAVLLDTLNTENPYATFNPNYEIVRQQFCTEIARKHEATRDVVSA